MRKTSRLSARQQTDLDRQHIRCVAQHIRSQPSVREQMARTFCGNSAPQNFGTSEISARVYSCDGFSSTEAVGP